MRLTALAIAALLLLAAPALAEDIDYLADPVYKSLAPDDPHPMADMIALAEGGDPRAQYILGDLYAKGKGGLAKNPKRGIEWFETAARNGFYPSFVRLAAMAKHNGDMATAYKWYTLAADYNSGPWRRHAQEQREAIEDSKKLSRDDMDVARKGVNVWKSELRAAEQAARDKEKAMVRAAREAEKAARAQERLDRQQAAKAGKDKPVEKDKPAQVVKEPGQNFIKTRKENPFRE